MFRFAKCMTCKHYHTKAKWKDDVPIFTCDAFPTRIPLKIFSEEVSHDRQYPGDHGIQYEPAHPDAK